MATSGTPTSSGTTTSRPEITEAIHKDSTVKFVDVSKGKSVRPFDALLRLVKDKKRGNSSAQPEPVPATNHAVIIRREPGANDDHGDRGTTVTAHQQCQPDVHQAPSSAERPNKSAKSQSPVSRHWLKSKARTSTQQSETISMQDVRGSLDVVAERCASACQQDDHSNEGLLRELQQECARLKLKLSEKEELLQSLIDQQLKKENVAVTVTDSDISRDLSHSTEARKIQQLQSDIERLQVDVNIRSYEITEHLKEIATLKNTCDARGQQIESLEEQNQNLIGKANELEIDCHTKAEENESLRREIERLKHEEHASSNDVSDVADGDRDEGTNPRSVLISLRLQIKQLNDDITRMREHTREQSRQILEFRQQADMTKHMEEQLRSMETIEQTLQEENDKLQSDLKEVRLKLNKQENERTLLDKELRMCKEESFIFSQEKDKFKAQCDTLTSENRRLLTSIENMSEISEQLVNANKIIKDLEQQLEVSHIQMRQYKDDFKAERRDRESAHSALDYDFQQLMDQLSSAKQENDCLKQDLVSARREAKESRDEYQTLCQEVQSKSSQVKQYAKEVDRLKRALQEARGQDSGYCMSDDLDSKVEELSKWSPNNLQVHAMKVAEGQTGSSSVNSCPLQSEDEHECVSPIRRVTSDSASDDTSSDYVNQSVLTEYLQLRASPRSKVKSKPAAQTTPLSSLQPRAPLSSTPSFEKVNSTNNECSQTISPSCAVDQFALEKVAEKQPNTGVLNNVLQESDLTKDDHEQNGETATGNVLEDSTALFENPLQKKLDDEIHEEASEVIQEVNGRRFEDSTDRRRPYDPNLVCPMCRKRFRIGGIQKFRRHVNTCTGTDDD